MRGNPRPRVAIGLPGSGCGVSRIIGSAGSAATAFLIKAALERVTRSCGRGGTTDHGGPATVCLDDAGEMRMPRGPGLRVQGSHPSGGRLTDSTMLYGQGAQEGDPNPSQSASARSQ